MLVQIDDLYIEASAVMNVQKNGETIAIETTKGTIYVSNISIEEIARRVNTGKVYSMQAASALAQGRVSEPAAETSSFMPLAVGVMLGMSMAN